jgi:hypothetical protein
MITVRKAADGPVVQTVEQVAFTFPANVAGQYNYDFAVQSELRGDPMTVVSFDNFTFQILVLGAGFIAPHTVRINVFYLVDILAPIDVAMHVLIAAHDIQSL